MSTLSRSQTKALASQRNSLRLAMEHDATRRFMRALLDSCGVFAANPSTGADAFFTEGQRSVGLGIIAELNAIDTHLFPSLLQEGANEVIRARVDARKPENEDDV